MLSALLQNVSQYLSKVGSSSATSTDPNSTTNANLNVSVQGISHESNSNIGNVLMQNSVGSPSHASPNRASATYPLLTSIATATTLPLHIVIILIVIVLSSMMTYGIGVKCLTILMGMVYPLWATLKLLEITSKIVVTLHTKGRSTSSQSSRLSSRPSTEFQTPSRQSTEIARSASYRITEETWQQADDLRDWLIYWCMYSTLSSVEAVFDSIFFWIPFYSPFKLFFLYWCFSSTYRGVHVMYNYFLRPLLCRHEEVIDEVLDDGWTHAKNIMGVAVRKARKHSLHLIYEKRIS